jgi:hypothetical protein
MAAPSRTAKGRSPQIYRGAAIESKPDGIALDRCAFVRLGEYQLASHSYRKHGQLCHMPSVL